MNKGFKNINKEVEAPKSIKKDVMWHVERVFFFEALVKHFTVNFGNAFIQFLGGSNDEKTNENK